MSTRLLPGIAVGLWIATLAAAGLVVVHDRVASSGAEGTQMPLVSTDYGVVLQESRSMMIIERGVVTALEDRFAEKAAEASVPDDEVLRMFYTQRRTCAIFLGDQVPAGHSPGEWPIAATRAISRAAAGACPPGITTGRHRTAGF